MIDREAGNEQIIGQLVRHKEDGTKYVLRGIEDGEIVLAELGDRIVDECPVEYGDECIDPDCDGRIGETERDPETLTAHQLYCYGCGLNWVERGSTWDESYSDLWTSFEFEEEDDGPEVMTDGGQPASGTERSSPPDLGVAATGYICQNEPEHPDDQPEVDMVSAGPSPGVICPECGRMADGPDDEIPYGDPPHYGPETNDENRSVDTADDHSEGSQ